jgi:ribosomal protein S18 acetylase RimI-like enzyme
VQAVLTDAREVVEQVQLTVATDNERARHLYESEGFVIYGREPRSLKLGERYLDECLMVRFLHESVSAREAIST